MFDAQGQVALIDVVRSDSHLDQLLDQFSHDVRAVVDAAQQYGLVAEGDTGVSKSCAGLLGVVGDLLGVVEVGVQPDGVILLQHVAQIFRNTHRAYDGSSGADTDDLHVGDLSQLLDDVFEDVIFHQKSVAAGEQNVSYDGSLSDVLDALIDIFQGTGAVRFASQSSSGAVSAVHGALVGDQEQNSVRISVGEAGSRGVFIFVKRVQHVRIASVVLSDNGNSLHSDRAAGIVRIHQGSIVRGDAHTEVLSDFADVCFFLFGEVNYFLQVFNRGNSVRYLPMPVVPLLFGNVLPQFDVLEIACHK